MKDISLGESLFLLFVVVPLSIVFSGWTITVLWDWFVVSTFKINPLSIPQGLGLSLMIGYFTHQVMPSQKREFGELIAYSFAKPLTCLVIGWVIHLFI